MNPDDSPDAEQGDRVMTTADRKALTIQTETEEEIRDRRAIVGKAAAHIVSSMTERNNPEKTATMA